MRGKVSMVMPCYNKIKYIGDMFDSIISQKWDNIELILINDGSTDGTRNIITDYEPKFRKRGYDVVIVDQDNSGVCAAAKAGLERVTGDYVCMIDADDELDPLYVSAMAECLDEHTEYDYCVCDRVAYTGSGKNKEFKEYPTNHTTENAQDLPIRFLMWDICHVVWIYMARIDYIRKCGIIENYNIDTKGSHEPSYVIPLTANGGRYKYIDKRLYKFNIGRTQGHSDLVLVNYTHSLDYYTTYTYLCHDAIEKLCCFHAKERDYLHFVADVMKQIFLYYRSCEFKISEAMRDRILYELIDLINDRQTQQGERERIIQYEAVLYKNEFIEALKKAILKNNNMPKIKAERKIVGYGVLGKNGRQFIPFVQGSDFQPTELWDRDSDNVAVLTPDFQGLRSDDSVIVFPRSAKIYEDVKKQAGTAQVFRIEDLLIPIIISKYNLDKLYR
jgi:glycosyltransferase involved in cell wall biosynthesis